MGGSVQGLVELPKRTWPFLRLDERFLVNIIEDVETAVVGLCRGDIMTSIIAPLFITFQVNGVKVCISCSYIAASSQIKLWDHGTEPHCCYTSMFP